jgi:gliding motility-associated-like protein
MKKYLTFLLFLFIAVPSFALHIAGGELYYTYMGPGTTAGTDRYQITLRLFRECHPVTPAGQQAAAMPSEVEIGVFANTANGGTIVQTLIVNRTEFDQISLQSPIVCIVNPPVVCYQIGYFTFVTDLPKQPYGYTIAYQTCCRTFSIQNIQFFKIEGQRAPAEGATYTCTIPGTNDLGPTETNSSAVFAIKDTVLVCQQKKVSLDFSATDPDSSNPLYGDSLSYSFCAAYDRGAANSSGDVIPSNPPYNNVTYNSGYSGSTPLGANVVINPTTGIITGIIGAAGGYVVNVCVTEWRHGKIISVHRKDFLLRVASCDFAAAQLKPTYLNCNSYTVNFQNESSSSAITSYYWTFGVPGTSADTSTSPTPKYTYSDTGTYTVKLVVNKGQQCSDSATTQAVVYPGFSANFGVVGNCLQTPYKFIDSSLIKYGTISHWEWNFGDNTPDDTTQNPVYKYSTAGTRNVTLTVTNTKGCEETASKLVEVRDKPVILLPFRDTLICSVDTLQLFASTSAASNFTWSPAYNIINPATANPFVYPKTTFTYTVLTDDGHGCSNSDSVFVQVADKAFISLGNDTTICGGDSVLINTSTNALYFTWQPATRLNSPSVMQPYASPQSTTTYSVVASISKKCTATSSIILKVVPYPYANAGPDTSVCFGKAVQLHAISNGSSFTWSPVNTLYQSNTYTPTAGPQSTTTYIFKVYDTLGCPKPGIDSVKVRVVPPVKAFAGNDTNVVVYQPLQLTATGGTFYTWVPTTALNNPGIYNPVALFTGSENDSITYTVKVATAEGCLGYDSITVHIFKTMPEIFIPTAFTPNADGKNDVLRPKVAGIKQFNYFEIFNRWGNLLFKSTDPAAGWDGTINGIPQPAGTYVAIAQAIDYTGRMINKKGTVVLVR